MIDDRLCVDLGGGYDRHHAQSVGTDKLMVVLILRAGTQRTRFGRRDWPPGLSSSC